MKPGRRPERAIQIDAGTIVATVPRNIEAMGAVARSWTLAVWAPASPPTVITSVDAVWTSACAAARSSTCRCIGLDMTENHRGNSCAAVSARSLKRLPLLRAREPHYLRVD